MHYHPLASRADLELHELPEKFRESLMALDVQLTKLFDELHSMVVFENMGILSSPSHSDLIIIRSINDQSFSFDVQTTCVCNRP